MTEELIRANKDILGLLLQAKRIGWQKMNENTIQRMMYLLQVLYSFKHEGDNAFAFYHFTTSLYGPYSIEVENSLVFLRSNEYVMENNGDLIFQASIEQATSDPVRLAWMQSLFLILGKYGEKNVFALTINDPEYQTAILTNDTGVLDVSNGSRTYQRLLEFKQCFEQTLNDTSEISDDEYLTMYFDYIFSQILN